MLRLKSISRAGIAAALQKANQYRVLNDPAEAESICLDVLEINSKNQKALVILLLAITDQFHIHYSEKVKQANDVVPRLRDKYTKAYYHGIILERHAKALLQSGTPGSRFEAYENFQSAMELFEKAETLRPRGNDNPILRWNACARTIMRYNLKPREEKVESMLE